MRGFASFVRFPRTAGMTKRRWRCTVPPMRHLLLTTFLSVTTIACGRGPDEVEPLDGSSGAFEGSSTGSEGSTTTPGGSSAADESEGSTGVWGASGGGDSGSTGEGTSTGVEDESGGGGCQRDPEWPPNECYIDAAGFCWCGPDCVVPAPDVCLCDGVEFPAEFCD